MTPGRAGGIGPLPSSSSLKQGRRRLVGAGVGAGVAALVVAWAAPLRALASGGVGRHAAAGAKPVTPVAATTITATTTTTTATTTPGATGPANAPPALPPGTSAPGSVRRPIGRHTPLPAARDLSPRPGVRYLVLFSVTNCPWCEIVRAKHLRHRIDSRRADHRIDVSEVMIDRDDPLVGPDGQPTTSRELARRLGVKVGPTVMAFDGAGRPVGEPVIGALIEDFYEAYLDQLLDQAIR